MNDIHVLPLVNVAPRYGPMGGPYPETVRIAMSDGKVITYRIDVPMPAPVLRKPLDDFTNLVGYSRKEAAE